MTKGDNLRLDTPESRDENGQCNRRGEKENEMKNKNL